MRLLRNKDAELSPWSWDNETVFIQEPSEGATSHLLNETMSEAEFQVHKAIDKLAERAKGINHPKYSVKPEYACFKHESARPAVTFID